MTKYFCKKCGIEISYHSGANGRGYCRKCYSKVPVLKRCENCGIEFLGSYSRVWCPEGKELIAFVFAHRFKCKDCGCPITNKTVTRGKGRCLSCGTKNAFKEQPELLVHLSQTAKERMSIPENCPFLGKHHTEETKQNISEHHIKLGLSKGEKNPNWQGGIWDHPYPPEFNKALKKAIRKRDNYICQNCLKLESSQLDEINKRLQIHHIDYNKDNLDKTNLITLCNKCNCLANYDRDFWYAYYTEIIKEIYKDI